MRFKVDENLPAVVAELLNLAGHDAETVHDEGLVGSPDPMIREACHREERTLISLDLDFADIRLRPMPTSHGVIVIRARDQERDQILSIVRRVLTLLESEIVAGRLWLIDDARVRIREFTNRKG